MCVVSWLRPSVALGGTGRCRWLRPARSVKSSDEFAGWLKQDLVPLFVTAFRIVSAIVTG